MEEEDAPRLPENLEELEIVADDRKEEALADHLPIITVNVGGMLFSTHSATLQKVSCSDVNVFS